MDAEELRVKALEACRQGPDAVMALVAMFVAELATRVAALEAENAALRARLNLTSRNSSKPPSSDLPGSKPNPKSQRTPSGRKPGGQSGHPGHTLRLVEDPDEVYVHAPARCQACGRSLSDTLAVQRERRQVVELPPVRARVVEHQAETKCCPECGAETTGVFPEGVTAPAQYGPGVATVGVYLNQEQLLPLERTCETLADLFSCPIAEGTLERMVGDCYERLAETEAVIKQGVAEAGVAHFDETGVNIGGETRWLHVASTPDLTFYAAHPKRGREAVDAVGVLPAFRGRAVHDGLSSYWQYAECAHALCNAHHLRELTFVEEELGQPWAGDLKALLREIKQAVDEARGQGMTNLPPEMRGVFGLRYDAALEAGGAANPPPQATGQRGRPKRGKAGSLVARLRERKGAVLAFMEDFHVPFDNNQAERDLRMVKVCQKVSGCFRTPEGAHRFCRIRGYVSTLRKQGMSVLSGLRSALAGKPLLPALS